MLIQPSQADVRRFFCGVYAKARTDAPLEPMEMLVSQWIDEHPEYHATLSDVDAALRDMTKADPNAENPFLRADDPLIAARLGMKDARPDEIFAELRARKNRA